MIDLIKDEKGNGGFPKNIKAIHVKLPPSLKKELASNEEESSEGSV
jgi:hypothetical protein